MIADRTAYEVRYAGKLSSRFCLQVCLKKLLPKGKAKKIELSNAQNPLDAFPRNFPVDGEVVNLLATSRCNGIWETTRHNRHNGLLPAPTC